jgi:hypothetical protein
MTEAPVIVVVPRDDDGNSRNTARFYVPTNVEEDVMEARNEKLNGALMFVAGGLLGAGLALLLAPQSGRRTRRDIVHLGKNGQEKIGTDSI